MLAVAGRLTVGTEGRALAVGPGDADEEEAGPTAPDNGRAVLELEWP